ncbi:MAG: 1-deoxy-D-xylulose-5-phosphate reductoisomerase [Phycisphaerae bacterium]|nr:1-deoxy-D-xylulose-5-phosphate reductoisomerase [Phycisphaerae bacterium]
MTSDLAPRRIIVLGATGSIGTNTLAVIRHLNVLAANAGRAPRFVVVGLAGNSNVRLLKEQASEFNVSHLAIADERAASAVGTTSRVGVTFVGADAARKLVDEVARPGDLVMGAMVGAAGIPATLAAIERGCDIALANKETLVAAGDVVMAAVARKGVRLLPVDSEHNAIFQCLEAGRSAAEVRRIVITASGGPFRSWPIERIASATVREALHHPTWSMGPKVTIDSASMMNKALEIIEAHWLFGLSADQIDAIVHPQSIVHSFVEFVDGSVIAQLSPPDMRTPIQHALTWPERTEGCSHRTDWSTFGALQFEPVDHARFPAIGLAWRVVRAGGTSGATFNAANEIAVEAFLRGEMHFPRIAELVTDALDALPSRPVKSLIDVLAADEEARCWARERTRAVSV